MDLDRDDTSAYGGAGQIEEDHVDIDAIPTGPSDQPECRICSGPAEENAPLFYPCKCSGSIKYIHQECLKTWLAQSKKRSCDICKHPYAFQKVYKPDMPTIIPPFVFARRILKHFLRLFITGFRTIIAVFVWLILVPYCTVWIWRLYFWTGDYIAWRVYGPPDEGEDLSTRPNVSSPLLNLISNLTSSNHTYSAAVMANSSSPKFSFSFLTSRQLDPELEKLRHAWIDKTAEKLLEDVFAGQIITTFIVVAFLATFLLREWIVQNAIPGVFGDDALANANQAEQVEGLNGEPEGVQEVAEAPLPQEEVDADLAAAFPPLQPMRPVDLPPVERIPALQVHPPLEGIALGGNVQRQRDNQLIEEARRRFREEGANQLRQDPAFIAEVRAALQRLNPGQQPRRVRVVQQPPPAPHHPVPDLDHRPLQPVPQQQPALPPLPHQPQLQRRNSMPGGFKVEPTAWSSSTQPTDSNPNTPSSALFFPSATGQSKAADAGDSSSSPSHSRLAPRPSGSGSPLSKSVPTSGLTTEDSPVSGVKPSAVASSSSQAGGTLVSLSNRVRSSSIDREDSAARVREWREKYFAKMAEAQRLGSSSSAPSSATAAEPVFKVDKGKGKAREDGDVAQEKSDAVVDSPIPVPDPLPSLADVTQRLKQRGKEIEQSASLQSRPLPAIEPQIQSSELRFMGRNKRRRSSSPSRLFQRSALNDHYPSKRKLSLDEQQENDEDSAIAQPSLKDDEEASTSRDLSVSLPQHPLVPDDFRFSFTTTSTVAPVATPLMSTVPDYNSPDRIFRSKDAKPIAISGLKQDAQPDAQIPSSSSYSPFQLPPIASASRRPPLLPTTPINELPPPTPRPGHVAAVPASAFQNIASSSRATPTTQSPGVVTYRPPEELEAATAGYFDHNPDGVALQSGDEDEDEPLPDGGFNEDIDEIAARVIADARRRLEMQAVAAAMEDPIRQLQIEVEPPEDDDAAGADEEGGGLEIDFADGGEDDMDGAMEAIGIRGPVHAVIQNAAIMMMVLDVAIFLGLWVPFTIGKTAALVTLRPKQGLWLLNIPIRVVRLVTDPLVDLLVFLVQRIILRLAYLAWPILGPFSKALASPVGAKLAKYLEAIPMWRQLTTGGSSCPAPTSSTVNQSTLSVAIARLRDTIVAAYSRAATTSKSTAHSTSSTTLLSRLLPIKNSRFDYVLGTLTEKLPPAFHLAERVRQAVQSLGRGWISLARGNDTSHRIFAVALGYVVMSIFVLLYLGAAGSSLGRLGRTLRKLVWQQWVIIKVAFFIVMEIIIFPLCCGFLVDFSLLPLFPDGQFQARIVFCNNSPLTCLFYHWTLGTSFMYQFAILLSSCRSLMRKGAMWFIKDPQDPNFSPVREILERPVMTQLRKLALSAVMYTAVIVGGVGGILFAASTRKFDIFKQPLLPLNLSMREPLSQIPIDLLFIHIFLGPSLQYARPKRHLLAGLRIWWKHAASFLRLTSYMFGTRHPAEEEFNEVSIVQQWFGKLRGTPTTQNTVFRGGFLRVPNTDNGAFPTNKPALIRVDEHGNPLTEAGAELMQTQNEVTRKAGREVEKDFAVVYVPPSLKYRIITFILLFWLTGSSAIILGLGTPIIVGRHIIRLWGRSPVHDGYTLIIGLYCLWGFVFVYRILFRIVKRRRFTTPQRLLLKLSTWFAASVYMVTMLGIVLPILLALVIDFYIILPIRLRLGAIDLPRIHIVESWAVGLLYAKIGIRLMRMEEANEISLALEAIIRDGLRRPQVWFATRYLILPVGGGMIGMIALPPGIMYAGQYFFPAWQQEQAAFRYGYPGVFLLACVAVASRSLLTSLRTWVQSIRDTEFLLELRLTNLEKTNDGMAEHGVVEQGVMLDD